MPAGLLTLCDIRCQKLGKFTAYSEKFGETGDGLASTVGAALCGRPLRDPSIRFCQSGGHGGPPLQLLLIPPITFYFGVTVADAEPPKLLRTVMFPGFVGQKSEALKRPLPLFFKVPIKASVDVT